MASKRGAMPVLKFQQTDTNLEWREVACEGIDHRFGDFVRVLVFTDFRFLSEDPNTKTFMKYVVDGFGKAKFDVAIDPFEVAHDYMNEAGRKAFKKYILKGIQSINSVNSCITKSTEFFS